MDKFKLFLEKSEYLRPGYKNSLEHIDNSFNDKWLKVFSCIPAFFMEIYTFCNGTKEDIENQKFFDFIPGYRLMTINEIIDNYMKDFENYNQYDLLIPFLADYSGSYYMYAKKDDMESIVLFSDGIDEVIHSSTDDFWNTIIAFYDEKVYFLDEDDYLSYDYDMESEIGKKYNPNIDYWC